MFTQQTNYSHFFFILTINCHAEPVLRVSCYLGNWIEEIGEAWLLVKVWYLAASVWTGSGPQHSQKKTEIMMNVLLSFYHAAVSFTYFKEGYCPNLF